MPSFIPTSRAKRRYSVGLPDVCCATVAPWFALALRDPRLFEPELVGQAFIYCGIALIVGISMLYTSQISNTLSLHISIPDGIYIVRCAFISAVITSIVAFLITRLDSIPRSVPVIHFLVLGSLLLTAGYVRSTLTQYNELKRQNVRSRDAEKIIVLGVNRLASFYIQMVDAHSVGHHKVMAILDASPSLRNRTLNGRQIIGAPEDLPSILHEYKIHGIEIRRVVVTADRSELSQAAWDSLHSDASIEVEFLAEHFGLVQHMAEVAAAQALPAASPPLQGNDAVDIILVQRRKYWKLKRVIDVVAACLLLVILAPVIAAVGFSVRLGIGSRVIFWQRRVGRNGAAIFVFKFRTLLAPFDGHGHLRDESERLSGLGAFLRRTRLDELPQLFNILRGEMSIVGPRPLLLIDQPPSNGIRLAVLPGITGWAQVHGGNLITPREKNALDEYYIRNASLWLDFKILVKTTQVLFFGDRPHIKVVERPRSSTSSETKIGSPASLEAKACFGPQGFRARGKV
jgi:lipopolysaccharide/colanic/teichoic acid biosynthesis glycosyltransferase